MRKKTYKDKQTHNSHKVIKLLGWLLDKLSSENRVNVCLHGPVQNFQ